MTFPSKRHMVDRGNRNIEERLVLLVISLLLVMTAFLPPAAVKAATYIFAGSSFTELSEMGPDGTPRGIGIEIVTIICKRLGHTPDIQLYPWARAQALVQSGETDVLIAPYKTPEREQWMDYSATSFFEDQSFFFVRHDSTFNWNGSLESVRDKRIGMVPAWSVGAAFEQAKPYLTIDYAPNLDICFRKLVAGRVDLVPSQLREASASFHRLGFREHELPVIIKPILTTQSNYFGFSRKKRAELQGFKRAFEQELQRMHASGEIAQLLQAQPPPLSPRVTKLHEFHS